MAWQRRFGACLSWVLGSGVYKLGIQQSKVHWGVSAPLKQALIHLLGCLALDCQAIALVRFRERNLPSRVLPRGDLQTLRMKEFARF